MTEGCLDVWEVGIEDILELCDDLVVPVEVLFGEYKTIWNI